MKRIKKNLALVVVCLFLIVCCVFANFVKLSLDFLLGCFPLDNPEAVLFTLSHRVIGAEKFLMIMLEPYFRSAINYSAIQIIFIFFVLLAIGLFLKYKKSEKFCLTTHLVVFLSLLGVVDALLVLFIFIAVPVSGYIKAYGPIFLAEEKQDNVLYEKDYVFPDSVSISFEKKNNLIFIIMESMEYNFQDSLNGGNLSTNAIPEITEYLKNEVSFIPGGVTVKGIGWTMGEVVAKTCGLPLLMPVDKNTSGIHFFLRNAKCLSDILHENEYSMKLVQGTYAGFASMGDFLESHGFDKRDIVDRSFFEKRGYAIFDTSFFHSIKDSVLYEESKGILADMDSSVSGPWAFFFFTMDTHGPYGRLDSNCVDRPKELDLKSQYPYVLKCSSKQLDVFLKWIKKQTWYEKTTVVVMGDHPAMVAKENVGYSTQKFERYWLNFIMNSQIIQNSGREREFTSFDMFPTVLEAMGANIEGRRLGLGRSLFANEETLIEKYGKDSLNSMLTNRGPIYNYFWE